MWKPNEEEDEEFSCKEDGGFERISAKSTTGHTRSKRKKQPTDTKQAGETQPWRERWEVEREVKHTKELHSKERNISMKQTTENKP